MGTICSRKPEIQETLVIGRTVTQFSKLSNFLVKYKFVSVIGKGAFGKVRLYRDRQFEEKVYAIKTLLKEGIPMRTYERLIEEVNILRRLDHPNIVKYYETFEDGNYLHIVMEYLSGDNLYKVFTNENPLDEVDICNIIKQLIKALIFIHNKNIIHRDIKMENILFGKQDDFSTLKLIDFGLSSCNSKNKEKECVGSPFYMSPEILKGESYPESDMWSVGVLLHIMFTEKFPFKGDSRIIEQELYDCIINEPFNPSLLNRCEYSEEGKDFVKRLLIKDHKRRLTSLQAITHPWFSKFGKNRNSAELNESTIKRMKTFTHKSALQKEVLFFLAKIIQEDGIDRLKKLFNNIDKTNCGYITLDEMNEAFNQLGYNISKQEMDNLWKGLDFHKEGKINYTEFLAATIRSINFSSEEDFWLTFKFFEKKVKKGTPYITVKSLIKATKVFGLSVDEKAIKKGFEDMKKKGKVLDFEEFKNLVVTALESDRSDRSRVDSLLKTKKDNKL